MSWAQGVERGRSVGYAVPDTCHEAGCDVKLTRGVAYRCASEDDMGCPYGGFFCLDHLFIAERGTGWRCVGCCDGDAA